MKTPSNDNLIKIRGTLEELEESDLNHREIRNFNRGRMFYKDGDTGEKFLIQCPFFNVQDDKHRFYMYKLLNLKDDEILRKIKRMKYVDELIIKRNNKEIDKEEFKRLVNEYDLKELNELNNVLINDNNDNNENIKNIEKIEKNEKVVASFEEEKTEKIEVLTDNNLNNLEEIRLKKWKETNDLQDKTEQSKKRKILFQVKKLIEKNELEERKNILNTL
ncbi:hypothetical protein [Aliarcobacter cryaerophilus]|nr:hypothetical protein [Aliarcobacter cryaerophilus]MCT7512424.1 hypothetical protein [Aliarcobacter cryaerophilus]